MNHEPYIYSFHKTNVKGLHPCPSRITVIALKICHTSRDNLHADLITPSCLSWTGWRSRKSVRVESPMETSLWTLNHYPLPPLLPPQILSLKTLTSHLVLETQIHCRSSPPSIQTSPSLLVNNSRNTRFIRSRTRNTLSKWPFYWQNYMDALTTTPLIGFPTTRRDEGSLPFCILFSEKLL